MNRHLFRVGLAGFAGLMALAGCVPQEDYDQQVMANRKLREELELARIELQDARSQAEIARSRLGTLESELQTKDRLADNLSEERDRHLEAFRRVQAAFEELASRKPQDPVVLTQALPPELDSALREFASHHPESVEFDSRRGIVKWKSDLLFALGSAVVMDSAKQSLREFAEIMTSEAASGFDTTIAGHTDNTRIAKPATRQKHPTNWHLSVHRAIAVMEVLRDYSVNEKRMAVMGFGALRPLVPNADAGSKAKNRRVEIYVVPRNTIALADTSGPALQGDQGKVELFSPKDTTVEK